jgi:hypothetical protein
MQKQIEVSVGCFATSRELNQRLGLADVRGCAGHGFEGLGRLLGEGALEEQLRKLQTLRLPPMVAWRNN